MDEPTSALDPISTAKIEELAMELKKNYTIVIVTHNMQQALRISDKTAFFLLGEVVEYATIRRSCSPCPRISAQRTISPGGLDKWGIGFDDELDALNTHLLEMGAMIEYAIETRRAGPAAARRGNWRAAIVSCDREIDQKGARNRVACA